jgi:retron-type reverse transcriptase
MPKIRFHHTYNDIISIENLLEAWKEFIRGKRARKDVQEFERDLMTNLIALHRELAAQTYSHSKYQHFKIADPKPRDIHIAAKYIPDQDVLDLMSVIVRSFHSNSAGVRLPLGNLTSQLLVNIYMNEFDQFIKHRIKAKYYLRYADDFVVLSMDKRYLFKKGA